MVLFCTNNTKYTHQYFNTTTEACCRRKLRNFNFLLMHHAYATTSATKCHLPPNQYM